jgi:hypothetical protein
VGGLFVIHGFGIDGGVKMKKFAFTCTAVVVLGLLFGFTGLSHASPGNLIGTVWDAETMLPVPGINVVVENDTHTFAAVTDEDGAYEFVGIPQGNYSIYIDAPEFYRLERQFAVGNETAAVDIAAVPLDIFEAKAGDLTSIDTPKAFTGTWKGTWRSYGSGSGSITLRLTSKGPKLKGTLVVTRTDCGTASGPFTGSYSSATNKISGHATSRCGGDNVRVNVKGVKSGKTVNGTYVTIVGGSWYDSGTCTLTKR